MPGINDPVSELVLCASLEQAVESATAKLAAQPDSAECLAAVRAAIAMAQTRPGADDIATLGEGWVADEALAIGLCAAIMAQSESTPGAAFERGMRLAVNHGGDSDTTGAIAGNILGTLFGVEAIPPRWLDHLELREEIETVANDLYRRFGGPAIPFEQFDPDRYPPW